ncbi:MAG: type II secretion system protein [Planctomycetota bacterium]|nr:type II secretion system protein [Planctomycetota bacterium]
MPRPSHHIVSFRVAFTLIELLVVISIIALLIGILTPAIGSARESARRVKCLVNLRSMGASIQLYMNQGKGTLPYVLQLSRPLDPNFPTRGDPSLIDVLKDFVDAPFPVRDTADTSGTFFKSGDPWICPSDRNSTDATTNFQPTWRVFGTSYEYFPGAIMAFAEGPPLFVRPDAVAKVVTTAMEQQRDWPVLNCAGDWHTGKAAGQPRQNALYFNDWRADWYQRPTPEQGKAFFETIARLGGRK